MMPMKRKTREEFRNEIMISEEGLVKFQGWAPIYETWGNKVILYKNILALLYRLGYSVFRKQVIK